MCTLTLTLDTHHIKLHVFMYKYTPHAREELSEQDDFPERELASLVASKVYYHLGSFQDSLTFALGAGEKFDVNGTSEYIETLLCESIRNWLCSKLTQVSWQLSA